MRPRRQSRHRPRGRADAGPRLEHWGPWCAQASVAALPGLLGRQPRAPLGPRPVRVPLPGGQGDLCGGMPASGRQTHLCVGHNHERHPPHSVVGPKESTLGRSARLSARHRLAVPTASGAMLGGWGLGPAAARSRDSKGCESATHAAANTKVCFVFGRGTWAGASGLHQGRPRWAASPAFRQQHRPCCARAPQAASGLIGSLEGSNTYIRKLGTPGVDHRQRVGPPSPVGSNGAPSGALQAEAAQNATQRASSASSGPAPPKQCINVSHNAASWATA